MTPRVSVVITALDEGGQIVTCLQRVSESVLLPCEILVVVDRLEDSTVPFVEQYRAKDERVRLVLNDVGPGPSRAIRAGVAAARADVVVVTMADGCDDPLQIDQLARLVERGVVIAAASRYVRGGQQVGGPPFKGFLSRLAGISLFWLARVGTRDATNSFKAYSKAFLSEVGIDSDGGFEVGIELVAKARRLRRPVAEFPTIWLDRSFGVSNFKLAKWLPRYLRWYAFAFGPRLTVDQVRQRAARMTS